MGTDQSRRRALFLSPIERRMNNPLTIRSAGLGIATKLLLWFLAIALVPCGALTLITTLLSRRALERSKMGFELIGVG